MPGWELAVTVVYAIAGTVGAAINTTILVAIVRSKLLWEGEPIYILSTAAIVDPTIRLFCMIGVWSPVTYYKESYLSRRFLELQTSLAYGLFLQFSAIQCLIATNRYFILTKNPISARFTRRFYVWTLIVLVPVTQFLGFSVHIILSCCKYAYDPNKFIFVYKQRANEFNYFNAFIFGPWCGGAITVSIVCYLRIYFITRKERNVADPPNSTESSPRTLEYSIVFIFVTLFFSGLELFAYTPLMEYRILCVATMIFGVCDGIAISLIQFIMNEKIRRSVLNLLRGKPAAASSTLAASSASTELTPQGRDINVYRVS